MFCFVPRDCIPIASLEDIGDILWNAPSPPSPLSSNKQITNHHHQHRSYVSAYNSKSPLLTRFDEHECWNNLTPHLPYDAIHKALPGWIVVCRKHLEKIIQLDAGVVDGGTGERGLWRMFDGVWAPEEVYFPTALAL